MKKRSKKRITKKVPWWAAITMAHAIGVFVLFYIIGFTVIQGCESEAPIEMYNVEEDEQVDTVKIDGA